MSVVQSFETGGDGYQHRRSMFLCGFGQARQGAAGTPGLGWSGGNAGPREQDGAGAHRRAMARANYKNSIADFAK